jgi:threonine dehydrogenase-like Zn-dependent dehydrogenase
MPELRQRHDDLQRDVIESKAPLVLGHEFPEPGIRSTSISEGSRVAVFPYIPCNHCEQCRNGNYHVCMS